MNKEVELWLIRHGQTDWNVEGRYMGHADIPLNMVGIQQAEDLRRTLQNESFDVLFSSDLLRARMTAEALNIQFGLEVRIDSRLREINQGEWEGHLIEDIKKRYQDSTGVNLKAVSIRPPKGETVVEVATRMADAANDICESFSGQRVLLVSHGLAVATLICQARGISLEEVYHQIPENAKETQIIWRLKK